MEVVTVSLRRKNRFAMAEGSAREAEAAVWIAIGWGYVTKEDASELLGLLDRVIAMRVRLRFPRKKPEAERDDSQ